MLNVKCPTSTGNCNCSPAEFHECPSSTIQMRRSQVNAIKSIHNNQHHPKETGCCKYNAEAPLDECKLSPAGFHECPSSTGQTQPPPVNLKKTFTAINTIPTTLDAENAEPKLHWTNANYHRPKFPNAQAPLDKCELQQRMLENRSQQPRPCSRTHGIVRMEAAARLNCNSHDRTLYRCFTTYGTTDAHACFRTLRKPTVHTISMKNMTTRQLFHLISVLRRRQAN